MSTLTPDTMHALVDDQPEEFRVSTSAYRGEDIFEQELERIFYGTWVYLCHESELANPGDFKSTQIGTRPVIVSKGRDGAIHAVLNVCTHRGATLCREETGNTRAFVCPYHGWSFRPSGELIGIPDEARYPDCFDKADKHLKAVPRIASYGGLVFGSFNPDVEDLETFLGGVKQHIDIWLKRTAGGAYRVATSHKYGYAGNWKFQTENVCDGYHPGFVHRSAFNTVRKFDGSFENRAVDVAVRPGGYTRGYPEGHGTLEAGAPLESGGIDPAVRQAYNDKLKALHGAEAAAEILTNRQFLIFPNLVIFDFNIRVIQPISHDRTEVYSYPLMIEGAHDEINSNRMLDAQTRVGTAGILSADDIDVFAGGQHALNAVGFDWITLSRGLKHEEIKSDGERIGVYSDEVPQRAFWRKWRSMMGGQA
ncbi:aromatic ring-hydroxylating oxygenase subunit alpha [Parapusillimonas granuli]|uniref:Rieske 2Fe-2S domain-containing protein n=1 Tax=Parapusillimonas granuli TaxID=380911 RepID=A0A853G6Q8_9BURK|nr:aromatic ring-hydroxylating dioxygenase subunit alpha [Parapusillimonas granuli]MBB5213930.1 benzoate/toluate 1,2-dioxygenase alpha subunit [Parapusillimonas granuli]MEB2400790.1 aromatic ring-hydroxylating dioxygenase subunit alpha [Alcaligenaceae bacterium]NYT50351.1 Rieske 2Fe-2S domain-containing protein [Parapusillimonas granuli]